MSILVTAPLNKEVTVAAGIERAFEVFTERIAEWWPLHTHSVGLGAAESLRIEGWVGGRLVETYEGGKEAEWGRVSAWEPPHRLAFSWYPGREGQEATEIEVTFTAIAPGETRVELEHRGWENLPEERKASRANYDRDWGAVLARYGDAADV